MKKIPITIKAIAEELKVSPSTVSRVLNGQADQYRISKKTAETIQEYAHQQGFVPNQIARGLRLQKTNTIGLIIPDISNPFFAGIARSIEIESRKKGYFLFLFDSREDTGLEKESIALLMSKKVDGLIVSPVGISGTHLLKLKQQHFPLVLIDRYFPEIDLPFIASDNSRGAFEATNYLIEKGHKAIACIQGLPQAISNIQRVQGFKEALEKAGIPFRNEMITGTDFGVENGYTQTKKLLKRTTVPSAIFALGNMISLGVIKAIAEAGLKIPEDISLISFDEQPYSAFLSTPMTTVAQDKESLGKEAVNSLLENLSSQEYLNEKKLIPTRLIERASVKDINLIRE